MSIGVRYHGKIKQCNIESAAPMKRRKALIMFCCWFSLRLVSFAFLACRGKIAYLGLCLIVKKFEELFFACAYHEDEYCNGENHCERRKY